MLNVYVIWRGDEDDFFVTLLQYEDSDQQRQAMQAWSTNDYVAQAFDAEYPEEDNPYVGENPASYECITIFEGDIRFIY